ncbi:zinc finger, C3HC4 type (RING finger) protein (macronuclear) [Tetrahymena thermophila SB210]|uniref:Zinc finger, C3HC4 type (RING finger) protein n=1 Tax=Tetrahymena thermophila (strain SB210) TaxID=312017 RepID=I7M443_TETTS|nr:zinc finger, C3HC4 type (RING finger) protein [Tetrahymena thermophila SB210]EAS04868.4 zinc finger, C3HC4 type (RING finger) protein [Tetrahymena thermophila SB210]|eukprot:XP_001025113.4 zinc finger, C3HC4 type (RING finger) protein [Tetrahymena thermophila SB210]
MEGYFKKNQTNQTFQVRKTNTNLLPLNRRSNLPNNNGTSFPVQSDDQRNNYILSSQQLNNKQQPQSFLASGISSKPVNPQNITSEVISKNNHFQFNNIPQTQMPNNPTNINQKFTNYNHFSEKQFTPLSTTNNNNPISNSNNNNNFLIQKNELLTKTFLNKPTEGQLPLNLNQQQLINKQTSAQNIQNMFQFETQNQNNYSPKRQQQLINDLQQENFNLKRELQKYREKDVNLYQENIKLQEKVKDLEQKLQDYENKDQQRKLQEQQKQQRRQRQREEMEIQRQYAYMLALEQIEQENNNQNQAPNVDNMTYEEIINLQDQIGYVSRGMKPEDINKIKEIRYDKLRMKDQSALCSICQCDFENNEKVKELNPCKHFYHPDCINQWLKNEKNCPVCKQFIQV